MANDHTSLFEVFFPWINQTCIRILFRKDKKFIFDFLNKYSRRIGQIASIFQLSEEKYISLNIKKK